MPVEQAVSLFSQTWPTLFEGQQLRPMKKCIREDMFADIAARTPRSVAKTGATRPAEPHPL